MILQKSYLAHDQVLFLHRYARRDVGITESGEGEQGHNTRVSSFVTRA
jgi:hypothetical protein